MVWIAPPVGESDAANDDGVLGRGPTLVVTLPCDTAAPGVARRGVQQWLAGHPVESELVDDVVLIVSELVTNAVLHARSTSRMVVSFIDESVRVEVHDESMQPPVGSSPSAAGGYGMRLVTSVADAWGWSRTSTGKVVWTDRRLTRPST